MRQLRGEGETDVQGTTRNMLRKVMKDKVATNFNWEGQGTKMAFKDMKTCEIIISK